MRAHYHFSSFVFYLTIFFIISSTKVLLRKLRMILKCHTMHGINAKVSKFIHVTQIAHP